MIKFKGGFYMMPPGFSSVCVGSCFWIHEQYQLIVMAVSFILPGPVHDPAITIAFPGRILPSVSQPSCPVLLPGMFSQSLLPPLQKPIGLSLYVLCYIFFSQICFHQIQPPFLLHLFLTTAFRILQNHLPAKLKPVGSSAVL